MTTHRIKLSIPSIEELTAGVSDLRALHPPLRKAEQALANAEKRLADEREKVTKAEALIADLPAKLCAGAADESTLDAARRQRENALLLIGPAEAEIEKCRKKLEAEKQAAQRAQDEEFARRRARLAEIAAPAMDLIRELRERELALSSAQYRQMSSQGRFPRHHASLLWPRVLANGIAFEAGDGQLRPFPLPTSAA